MVFIFFIKEHSPFLIMIRLFEQVTRMTGDITREIRFI